jgi:cytochrome c553
MMKTTTKLAFTTLLLFLVTGVALAAPAAENWDNLCTSCHGADGKAQTKTGKKLKLRDYTEAKVQAELKDDAMTKAIADGVKIDGKEKMKAYKEEISDSEIQELVAYVRKFKA